MSLQPPTPRDAAWAQEAPAAAGVGAGVGVGKVLYDPKKPPPAKPDEKK